MTESTHTRKESPLACDMSVIEHGQRERHIATARQLFHTVTDILELPDGYAFSLSGAPDILLMSAEFISLERLCCPFLGFAIEVEPEDGPVWLHLTGREGVKAFIREEVGGLLGGAINWAV
jgi:hypothetical protein